MKFIYGVVLLFFIAVFSTTTLSSNFKEFEKGDSSSQDQASTPQANRFLAKSNNFNEDDGTISNDYVAVMTLNYRGEWNSFLPTSQLDYFAKSTGFAWFTARKQGQSDIDNYIEFWIYDGQYVDGKAAKISFTYNNNTDFNASNSTFSNNDILFHVQQYDNFAHRKMKICQGSYKLNFVDATTQTPYQKSIGDYENIVVDVSIQSYDCNVFISAQVAATDGPYESNVMDYSIMITLICICHLYACMLMIKNININEASGNRYSLVGLASFTSWDIFLCLFHLYYALTEDVSLFHYFISPAFWYFILSSIFETRLLTLVWKIQFYRFFQNMADVRRGFATFYLKTYGFFSLTLFLGYLFIPHAWILYITAFFFLPQIIHNCVRGQKPKLDIPYILFLGCIRILLPIYARSCPNSIFQLTPNTSFPYIYTTIVLSQVFIMYLQSKLGARFFIPSYFLPPMFNYYMKNTIDQFGREEPCSICMDKLGQDPSEQKTPLLRSYSSSTNSTNTSISTMNVQLMQTPCKHIFHDKCLKDWMEIKLECPYCRSVLPPLE